MPTISSLQRVADRLHAGGVAETIDYQLEQDVIIDVPRSREALVAMHQELTKMIAQSLYLEQVLESTEIILGQEKRLMLELRVENKGLVAENANLHKENRRLKREIDKLMSNG